MRRAGTISAQMPRPAPARVHPITCRCDSCAAEPAMMTHQRFERRHQQNVATFRALNQATQRWARQTLIGLGIGITAAWLLDLAIDGPGILIIFGVGS